MKWLTFIIIAFIIILSAGLISGIVAMQIIGMFGTIIISALKIGLILKEYEKTEREIIDKEIIRNNK